MKGIGILPGKHLSYMDHLVPLCQLMHIPILVTDCWIKELIEFYYPPMQIILAEPEDYNLDPFLKDYSVFVYADFFRKRSGCFQFWDYYTTHNVRSVMTLHGNPDKYWEIYWIEQLQDEDIVLAYGSQLLDLLTYRGVSKRPIICGNFRLEYYHTHASFFDRKIPFKKEKRTLLYAPTWTATSRMTEHKLNFSPFFDVYRDVFDTLGEAYQLIVKLHPHLVRVMPEKLMCVMEEYPHVYFLQDFPLIYPLLKQIDVYLGDYSSIGYDFLYFDRPLFFLQTAKNTPLQAYGRKISLKDLPLLAQFSHLPEKLLDLAFQKEALFFQSTSGHDDRSEQTQQILERGLLYKHVFGQRIDLNEIKKSILHACRSSTY